MTDLEQFIFFLGLTAVAAIGIGIALHIQERNYQKRKKKGLK